MLSYKDNKRFSRRNSNLEMKPNFRMIAKLSGQLSINPGKHKYPMSMQSVPPLLYSTLIGGLTVKERTTDILKLIHIQYDHRNKQSSALKELLHKYIKIYN